MADKAGRQVSRHGRQARQTCQTDMADGRQCRQADMAGRAGRQASMASMLLPRRLPGADAQMPKVKWRAGLSPHLFSADARLHGERRCGR